MVERVKCVFLFGIVFDVFVGIGIVFVFLGDGELNLGLFVRVLDKVFILFDLDRF